MQTYLIIKLELFEWTFYVDRQHLKHKSLLIILKIIDSHGFIFIRKPKNVFLVLNYGLISTNFTSCYTSNLTVRDFCIVSIYV